VRLLKFVIYATLTVIGIALAYQRVSAGIRDGASGWAEIAPLIVWGAAGLVLCAYAFLLAAELGAGRRHRLGFDIAAFVLFCFTFAGRLLGL
jgi:hypothetical protein